MDEKRMWADVGCWQACAIAWLAEAALAPLTALQDLRTHDLNISHRGQLHPHHVGSHVCLVVMW